MHRCIALAALAAACSPARGAPPPDPRAEAAAVLERHCRRCHDGPEATGGFDIFDLEGLQAKDLIEPGDPAGSPIVQRMTAGEMPPETVQPRPTAAELAAVRTWIDQMTTAGPLRSDADVEHALAADLAGLAPSARPHARWLTLVHLANAGVPEPQLARYRTALAVMLASLSWSPAARAPVAVDAARTIFRIDLRDLGWSAATWDAIRAAYPYGVARPAGVPDAIRADWLVATASRPPLYHAILGIPDRDTELARLLGVDLAAGVADGRVARAGFTTSGISVNNRVIERHATRHGALWRSYDFRSSRGREDVFAHPLDFVPAGGELIFNLPNGLQGYMLVDGAGRRIDKAPTAIVSDPRRPDRAVETAVSCIGCHGAGIIERADQLRGATAELSAADRARILELHPPADRLASLYAADRARFAAGLAALGAAPVDRSLEPVSLLTARYEAELDLRLAAAELGLTAGALERRLARSAEVRRALAGLAPGGGRIKRETWELVFSRALVELGLGVPFTPRTSHDTAPPVWLDRRRRTWIVVPGAFDQAGALAACRARTLDLPREGELVPAIADGLGAGLRLGAPLWTAGTRLDASNQRYAAIVDPFTGTARRADAADRHGAVCVQL